MSKTEKTAVQTVVKEPEKKPINPEQLPEVKKYRAQIEKNYQSIVAELEKIDNSRNQIFSLRLANERLLEFIGEIKRRTPIN